MKPVSISSADVSSCNQIPFYLYPCPKEALKILLPLATLKLKGIETTSVIKTM